MNLCITAAGNTLEANTDPSFGRAPWLILVDTETLAFEAVENSGMNSPQGAGIAAAQILSNKGAQALFTGKVGPKAWAALEASGIAIHEGIGNSSIRDAVLQFTNNTQRHPGVSASQAGPRTTPAAPGPNSGGRAGSGMGRCGGGSGMGRGSGGRCGFNRGQGERGGR